MNSRRTPATPNDVCTHFGVTRSTAYRWLRGYARAKGVPDLRGQLRLPDKPTGEHENETDPHH
jgi:transposase-like protein